MLLPNLSAALLLLISFAMVGIATLAHVLTRSADTRFAIVVTLLVACGGLTLAPLLFLRTYLLG